VHNIKSSRQRAIRLELTDVVGVKAGEVEHERRVGADPGHAAVEASSAETLAEESDLDLSDGDIGQHGCTTEITVRDVAPLAATR